MGLIVVNLPSLPEEFSTKFLRNPDFYGTANPRPKRGEVEVYSSNNSNRKKAQPHHHQKCRDETGTCISFPRLSLRNEAYVQCPPRHFMYPYAVVCATFLIVSEQSLVRGLFGPHEPISVLADRALRVQHSQRGTAPLRRVASRRLATLLGR